VEPTSRSQVRRVNHPARWEGRVVVLVDPRRLSKVGEGLRPQGGLSPPHKRRQRVIRDQCPVGSIASGRKSRFTFPPPTLDRYRSDLSRLALNARLSDHPCTWRSAAAYRSVSRFGFADRSSSLRLTRISKRTEWTRDLNSLIRVSRAKPGGQQQIACMRPELSQCSLLCCQGGVPGAYCRVPANHRDGQPPSVPSNESHIDPEIQLGRGES
jgi:hypothetical protein